MKICILTDDKRFYRMLELELYEMGFEIISEDELVSCTDRLPVLCDLDCCDQEKVKNISHFSEIFGWSKKELYDNPCTQLCSCFFQRPFLISELKESLKKFLTGSNTVTTEERGQRRSVSEFGRRKNMLTCNYQNNEASFGSYTFHLTPTETDILKLLCDNREKIVTRAELNDILGDPDGNIADVYICKLRNKIDNQLGIKFIYTVKGKGYMFK